MFDIETCVAFVTNRAAKEIADSFNEMLIPLGTTRVQWIALYHLYKFGAMSQIELGEKMNIKGSSVVKLVDRLQKEGYVKREKNLKDRRSVNLILTEEGREFIEKLMPEGEKMSKLISKGLTDEEIEIFTKVLEKMLINIK